MHARVREARRRTGKSQEEFAALLEVSRGAVAQWEMETGTTPSVKNLAEIARTSGVMFEWLATGRGPRVFGEAMMVREDAAPFGADLAPDEKAVLAAMKKMKPAQRAGLIAFLGIEKAR